ncbi:MAG: nucleic acid-binding protein [Acidobacteriota bacterium]|nr:nucleic acid-binding protein [Acidobacteriota bacterium]
MSKLILLDSGPLGLASNPRTTPDAEACRDWIRDCEARGDLVVVSEVADYEVRRELLRARKSTGIARLDIVKSQLSYLAITTQAMLKAAELWAQARHLGKQTADDSSLDADMILAAQAVWLIHDGNEVIVATTNPKHLSLFVPAARWQDIN